jgi:23S rRNA (uracil1939-C5)-methyltransferase
VRDGRIGFMREESHDICAVGPTRQMLAATVRWIEEAETRLRDDRLRGLSSIEIAENIPASERACHLELEPGTEARPFAALATDAMTGLSAQVLDRRGVETLTGVPVVSDSIGALVLKRDVRAFFQANRFLLEPLVRHVLDRVPASGPVVDLYAGVGLFGLSLAAAGREAITLVEGEPVSARDLEENARPFPERTRVERSSVEDFLRHSKASPGATFIVDPPRTGMSREAVQGILHVKPARLLYVSCDVATLARDVRALVDHGYALAEQISAFDLFPNTAHVESVCLLGRDVENR